MDIKSAPPVMLTWNPKVFSWVNLAQDASKVTNHQRLAGGTGKDDWTTRCLIKKGTRFFLAKSKKKIHKDDITHGIMGSGYLATDAIWDEKANKEKPNPQKPHRRVGIYFDALLDPAKHPLLSLESLGLSGELFRASGTEIPEAKRDVINTAWENHLQSCGVTPIPQDWISKRIDETSAKFTKELTDKYKATDSPTPPSLLPVTSPATPLQSLHPMPQEQASIPYTIDHALSECFLEKQELQNLLGTWKFKKNLVLQGSPGVGKSHIAHILAKLLTKSANSTSVTHIQFHQSFGYEDFIQGWRPSSANQFQLVDGLFLDLCVQAEKNPDQAHVLTIDEINRGNISRIFGEAFSLIENTKRSTDHVLIKDHHGALTRRFSVPPNIFILATMNPADRSLAPIDAALRRRFAFHTLKPKLDSDKFINHLVDAGLTPNAIHHLQHLLAELNKRISEDKELTDDYLIGHSYFCHPPNPLDPNWLKQVFHTEIKPLLKEYWRENLIQQKNAFELVDSHPLLTSTPETNT